MSVRQIRGGALFVLLVLFSTPQALLATSILQVDVDALLEDARYVVEGEVIASEARWNEDKTRIATHVTIRIKDVVKGNERPATMTVSFSGGVVGDNGLHVSGMVYPAVGETGIYFLNNPAQRYVNPLVGWGQGHFRVSKDSNGVERILTERGVPVLAIDDAQASDQQGKSGKIPLSKGVARGIRTGKAGDALTNAMEKSQFKAALKSRMSKAE